MSANQDRWTRIFKEIDDFRAAMAKKQPETMKTEALVEIAAQLMHLNGNLEDLVEAKRGD